MENSNISIGAIETGCNGSAPTYFFGSSVGSGLINKSTSSLNYSEQVVKRIYFKKENMPSFCNVIWIFYM